MNAVPFDDVTLALGGRAILAGVNLDDPAAQEFVGVLGPNGAGKTTLMRAVLGLAAAGARQRSACWAAGNARQSGYRLHAADRGLAREHCA